MTSESSGPVDCLQWGFLWPVRPLGFWGAKVVSVAPSTCVASEDLLRLWDSWYSRSFCEAEIWSSGEESTVWGCWIIFKGC